MTGCDRQGSGVPADIVLYFYDELEPPERSAVERHLSSCPECRRSFEELSMIRSALAVRPRVDAPPHGDWTPFMERLAGGCRRVNVARAFQRVNLSEAVRSDDETRRPGFVPPSPAVRYASYLTMAALLTLVTAGVVYVARSTLRPTLAPSLDTRATRTGPGASIDPVPPALVGSGEARSADAAFAALSEQHFERSKLVVLGLASKDPHRAREADWAWERGLASNLLSDTRLYRLAAEQRGMRTLAGIMGDLELVLLQTSLADAPDAGALEQIQRLIDKRDLVAKMDRTADFIGS